VNSKTIANGARESMVLSETGTPPPTKNSHVGLALNHIVTTSLSLALLALVTGMSLALLAFVVGIVASISWQRAHLPHGLAAPHASTCASDDSSFALRSLRVSICACSAALVPCCFISTALSRCTTAVSERSLDAYAPGTL
jgi:hypothetical protein